MAKTAKHDDKPKVGIIDKIERFSRNKYVIALLVLILSIVYFVNYTALYDRKIDMNGDNIYYFALGKALHEGKGYTTTLGYEEAPHTHFPPGYSAFISVLFNVAPDDVQFVKKANGVLLYLCVLLLFGLVMMTTRNSILAFCSSLLVCLHTELLHWGTIMMSEILMIFLALLSLFMTILLVNWKFNPKRKWLMITLLVLLAAVSAYIYFVKTLGLAVILALIGYSGIMTIVSFVQWRKSVKSGDEENRKLLQNRLILRFVTAAVIVAGTATAMLSWEARNRSIGFTGTDYKKDFLLKPGGETMQTIDDWVERLKTNSKNFVTRYVPKATYFHEFNSEEPVTPGEWAKGILLAALLIVGAFYIKKGGLAMIFFVWIDVMVLLFFPEQYAGTRYLTPIMPILILLFLAGICGIISFIYKIAKRQSSPWLLQSFVVLIVTFTFFVPTYTKAQEDNRRLASIKSWTQVNDVNMVNYIEAAKWCGDNLSDTARIMCRKPEIFYMFSKFHKSTGMPWYGEPDTILQRFRTNNLQYVIIDSWFRHGYATIYPCVQKYPEKFKLVKQIGEVNAERHQNPTLIFEFNDEWGYTGDMVNGIREGQGVLKMNDGRRYEGAFSANAPNGFGILYDQQGKILLKGIWQNGIFVRPQ